MAPRRTLRMIALLWTALALACASTPEPTPELPWDQAAVTELAKNLTGSVTKLLDRVRAADTSSNPQQDRIRSMAQDDIQRMQTITRQLANRLGNGDGREATYPSVQALMTMRNDLADLVRRAATGEEADRLLESAAGYLDQLTRYYVSASD